MTSDLINGGLELTGAFLNFRSVLRLLRDKKTKGICIENTFFFTLWGVWNLFFYPLNHLWFSYLGGIALTGTNTIWITLAYYYANLRK